ncbi:MAG: J domain-containing protein [Ignavibacteriales bacterium]|nr:J domain-containing protein [Ignavibacteriales bacterium]
MDFKDYYKILGVGKTATQDEIRKAYRKLAKRFHPDKNQGDKSSEEKFKEINEANEVLSDPDKRKKYDRLGSNWNNSQFAGSDFDNWFKNQSSSRNKSSDFSGNFKDIFEDYGGFSDLFENFMGGRTRTSRVRVRKGADYEAALHISLEEAFSGIEKQITVDGRTLKVKINPGIEDGKKLRLKNQGASGLGGGDKGDLYLTIHIGKQSLFERKGNDLYLTLNVDLFTAILGGKKQIKTLDGKTISIDIPKETENGKLLRIKGMGFRDYDNNSFRGDLFIKINITIPQNLSHEEIKLFNKLAELRKGKLN